MTKRLEEALAKVRTLPANRQDDAAALLLHLVEQDEAAVQLSAEQIAEIERRLAEADARPDDTYTHEQVFDELRRNFRP